ncbi:protein phosphatase 1 regulatory subunit 3E-like [Pogona vitticeps]
MEKAGSLHASVPTPPPRLYLPRHFSCSACLYGRLAEPCKKGGGCSPEPEAVEVAADEEEEEEEKAAPAGTATAEPPRVAAPAAAAVPRSPSPPLSPPSPSPRGREPTVPSVPPSPTLRRRAKSLPTPGERGLRPALQQQSPARRKTVRFADSLGLELTAVRHFCQGDAPGGGTPLAAAAAVSPLLLRAPGSASASAAALLKTRKPPALGELEPVLFGPPAPVLEPLFPPPPGVGGAAFAERLRQAKVRLEWVRPEAAALRGAVRVLNLAYEKRVSVRYTLNRWASCHEVPAAYQPPPGPDGGGGLGDRFVFHLPVDAGTTGLEFAVRYCVAGAEFWDNNDGRNYKLRARHPRPPPDGSEPGGGGGGGAWIHFI